MCNFGIVENALRDKKLAKIKPYLSDSCMGCPKDCGRYGKPYIATNPKLLDLPKNSVVRLRVSRIQYFVQGFFSLALPIFSAFLGYFLSSRILEKMPAQTPPNTLEFLAALIFFLVSAAVVYLVSRADFKISKPEIVEVILESPER